MKTLQLYLILSLAFIGSSAYAQTKQHQQIADELFKDTKEIRFQFYLNSKADIKELTKIISIDNVQGLSVQAFASKKGFLKFLEKNYPYNLMKLPREESGSKVVMMKEGQSLKSARAVSAYPTYPQYVSMMQQFAMDYPSLCTFHDLGTLPSGHKILAVRISDNPGVDEDEPEFLYTSTMHGDETAGYPMMLSLIEHLLQNYGTDSKVTNLINNCEIWINPLANPDGTYMAGDLTVAGATRYNDNGVDLNRNYPDPQDGLHPDGEAYQPETIIFMDFAEAHDFVMAANFHGGAEVANFPWDTWATDHPDKIWWEREAREYADSCQANGAASYMNDLYSGSFPGVTNGFDWYEVNGGRQDYMQWWHQCKEFTVELSTDKLLAESSLEDHFNYNLPSLLNYMESSLYGIRGIITDQCTGQPIRAKVFLTGHDFDSSFVYSSLPVGNYHRPINPGTYSVVFSAPGYATQTITGVNVASYSSITTLNVQLVPQSPTANFTTLNIGSCDGIVEFSDLTGSASSWSWDFGDGNVSTSQNPSHAYTSSGTYTVTLTATNCAGTDTEIKTSYINITVATPPTTTGATSTSCAPASLTLGASGTGTLAWYDAPTGGTLVNTGTSYTTPVLSTTTTYYVQSQNAGAPQNVGKPDNTGGGGYFTGSTYHYLIFDAAQAFTLNSVRVYANTTGARTIQLRNSAGTVLQSATVTIPSGMSTVTLNFNVPAGTGLQLGTAGGTSCNLWRTNGSAVFPYSLSGIVDITGSSAGSPGYYYYFYNWEITTDCNSARTPVTATISGIAGIADISISTPDNSICAGASATFTAVPTSGGTSPSYQWQVNGSNVGTSTTTYSSTTLNNGDVVTCIITSSDPCVTDNIDSSNVVTMTVFALPSTPTITMSGADIISSSATGNQWYLNGTPISGATNSTFTPVVNGTYYCLVTDGNGCASDTSNTIVLTTVGINEIDGLRFNLYPNPATTQFTLETNISGTYTLTLFDQLGQKVMVKNCDKPIETIQTNQLRSGVYFVQMNANGVSKTMKLVLK